MNNKIGKCLALISLVISPFSLDETYSHTGPIYNTASSPYTSDMFVSGSFTTTPAIPPNSVDVDLRPIVTSWSFSDGWTTASETHTVIQGTP
jgi:hypothetical protein